MLWDRVIYRFTNLFDSIPHVQKILETHDLSDDTVFEITCTYNDECVNEDIRIKVGSGYKALITVKTVDIDGTNGDFILIKSGKHLDIIIVSYLYHRYF